MAHDDGAGARLDPLLTTGSLLGWRIPAEQAEFLGELVLLHDLGTWAAAPIGLGREVYFDVELQRPVSLVTMMLIIGRAPDYAY